MFKRKRIAILASSLALAAAGAATLYLVAAPAASASTQVTFDIVNLAHGATISRGVTLTSSTRGKVVQFGLLPYGADSERGCGFALLNTSYTYGKVSYEVENTSADQHTCSADVVAAYVDPLRTWSTSSLKPGQSRGWTWNNANPLSSIYLAGLEVPDVAGCSMHVSRAFYRQQPGGEREFVFYVRNNGTTECTGTVLLARVASSRSFTASFEAGATRGAYDISYATDQRPAARDFRPAVFGVSPQGATDRPCVVQLDRIGFGQSSDDGDRLGGSTSSHVLAQNIGGITCSAKILAAELS